MLSQNARTVHSCKFAEAGVRWNCRKKFTFAANPSGLFFLFGCANIRGGKLLLQDFFQFHQLLYRRHPCSERTLLHRVWALG